MSWHISGQQSGQEKLGMSKERLGIDSPSLNFYINTNAINLITSIGIAPHLIPLPSGERGG